MTTSTAVLGTSTAAVVAESDRDQTGTGNDAAAVGRYRDAERFAEALESERKFLQLLVEEGVLEHAGDELLDGDVSPAPAGAVDGELVGTVDTRDGPVVQLNVIKEIDDGAVNVVIYPESDRTAYATVTRVRDDTIAIYRRERGAPDGALEVLIDDYGLDDETVSTQDWPNFCDSCPDDDRCCECRKTCVNDCCQSSCTPVYEYRCFCGIRCHDPRCWSDCY
ncbi:hypothetical protein C483_06430 [Natrialba hulunbeirensis JCM 10989]|uniref:Uncharacterized protein n=1 Tax=Natrialba hulunbeirensis JCM 10989 TaxID=1227493 RepID=M0A3P7_9EURY|nr:hypothetical protein [Natrialba hulunbeirensis]ELY92946.1 hypothetical protein C483_06430 [Natrialba hulunbeirensis JCM 10989]